MANTIVKGDDLMLFDAEGKSLAFATSHTFNLTGETVDTSSKDHGVYTGTAVQKVSWEITSENLYSAESFDKLFEMMVAREAVQVYFGMKAENDPTKTVVNGDYENWSMSESHLYGGMAFITSLSANAANGENATFSVTLTGNGKVVKVETV